MNNKTSIVPLLTSFKSNEIDIGKMVNHGDNLIKNGLDYLFLAGTTGLGPILSMNERKKVMDTFSYIPYKIILQCGSLNLYESMDLARSARESKIYAVGALPPYYFTDLKREWIINYFVKISKIYPTIIYNYPATTGYNITYDIVNEIKKNGGNIIGIKETTFNMNEILSVKYNVDNIDVYTGPGQYVLSSYRENLDGFVAGAANYGYDIIKKISENYSNKNGDKYQLILNKLISLSGKYGPISSIYDLVKIITGVDAGEPRAPFLKIPVEKFHDLKMEVDNIMKSNM